ncbi:hypothetical protein B7Z17_02055, partial [Candidatus Saccharibacteria bacterium 32-49-10]
EELIRFIQENLAGRYKLAVLSNMNGGTAEEMLGEYTELFDQVMLSGELGVAKPDARAFLLAAQRLGEFPDDCVMIDDSQQNCVAAEDVGMRAVYYRDLEQLRQKLAEYGILTP